MRIISYLLMWAALTLLLLVDWKVAIGVILFRLSTVITDALYYFENKE